MPEADVAIVRRLIETWGRGDYATALESIDPEIELTVAFQMDLDGTYRGHAGLAEYLGAFWAEFELQRSEIEEVIPASGGQVVMGVRFYGRGKRSRIETDVRAWHVWTVRDGKAVRWQVLSTKEAALRAAGGSPGD